MLDVQLITVYIAPTESFTLLAFDLVLAANVEFSR